MTATNPAGIKPRSDRLPDDFFDLVPQSAVRYSNFPDKLPHNAIWDFGHGPGNTMYASLCGEGGDSVSVRLYEYHPGDGALRFCFDGGPETMADPRAIPPSKIHLSMHPTRDGKLIMATHTTAKGASHPYWLFDQYFTHTWEGFAGSHVIEWDPVRREMKVLGIPVVRESIYGAAYDAKSHAYWFTTYLKGHLFRLDLASRAVQDLGQISEYGSYALFKDRLGNLYTASRSGHVFHINVDTQRVTDLGELVREPRRHAQRILGHHAIGPDGRSYVSFRFSDYLYAIDPETLKVEQTAAFLPRERIHDSNIGQKGLAFDSKDVLWSVTMGPMNVAVGCLCHLYRWDILRGGSPEYVGLLGTPDRATTCVSEMMMDEHDVLHLADTNHGIDPPGVLAVDTCKLTSGEARVKSRDPIAYMLLADGGRAYPGRDYETMVEKYRELARSFDANVQFLNDKANSSIRAKSTAIVRAWQLLGRGEAAVAAMRWLDDRVLLAWCGPGGRWRLRIEDGRVVERLDKAQDLPPRGDTPTEIQTAQLPARQGRQFLAKPSCFSPWNNGRWLIGSRDGTLACFDSATGKTFALGAVGVHGPIHQIATDGARTRAFGVAGDPEDLGHVFHYDDATGLREVGRTFLTPPDDYVAGNSRPTTVAVSPDGKRVAVGVTDALACVYIFTDVLID